MVEFMAPDCENSCHRYETESRSCPAGYTGTTTWEGSQTFTMRKYANPVPARSDEEFGTSAWSWRQASSSCTLIVNTGYSSDDDDDDDGGWSGGRNNNNNNNGNSNSGNSGRGHPGIDSTPQQDRDRDRETGGYRNQPER